jgi:hypothetical protein
VWYGVVASEGLRSVGADGELPIQERVLYPARRSPFTGRGGVECVNPAPRTNLARGVEGGNNAPGRSSFLSHVWPSVSGWEADFPASIGQLWPFLYSIVLCFMNYFARRCSNSSRIHCRVLRFREEPSAKYLGKESRTEQEEAYLNSTLSLSEL